MKFSLKGKDIEEFSLLAVGLDKVKQVSGFREIRLTSIHTGSIPNLNDYLASTIIHVLTYCSPARRNSSFKIKELTFKDKVFTLAGGIGDAQIPEPGQLSMTGATELCDDKGTAYGCIFYNVIVLYFDLPHSKGNWTNNDYVDFVEAVIQDAVNKVTKFSTKDRKKLALKLFLQSGGNWAKKRIDDIETNRKYLLNDIKSYEKHINKRMRDIMASNYELQTLKNIDFRGKLFKVIENISKNKKVEKIDFTTNSCEVYTNTISLTYSRKIYHIGRFKISFFLDGGLTIHNRDIKKGYRYDHPHVSEGNPCLGNISDVTKFISSLDFDVATEIVLKFLSSYNGKDAFVSFLEFMEHAFPTKRGTIKKEPLVATSTDPEWTILNSGTPVSRSIDYTTIDDEVKIDG